MYGYIYLTRNKVNNKIYIGQHKADNYDENYIGSGKLLKRSIEKYGIENFENNIIKKCNSQKELDEYEKYYIKEYNSQNLEIGYNIADGGNGGNIIGTLDRDSYNAFIEDCKLRAKGKNNPNYGNGDKIKGDKNPSKRKEVRKKISEKVAGEKNGMYGRCGEKHPRYGKKNSPETREKIKQSLKKVKYNKVCKYCGKEFTTNAASRQYCNDECKMNNRKKEIIPREGLW